jgi:hypothetical protein
MLVHAAETLEILRATAPLPGFADDELPLERQTAADGVEQDDPRLPRVLASLIREVAATGTPRELPEFRQTQTGVPRAGGAQRFTALTPTRGTRSS